jgi:hypothetical protein
MDQKNLRIINEALMNARNIIEIAARPAGSFDYNDFTDDQLRDMFYEINSMCLKLNTRINKE